MKIAVPSATVALKLITLRQAAVAGLGLAALPCYLGDMSAGLIQVLRPDPAMASALWILIHEDLRRTARIRAFTEFAAAALARQRPLLEGMRPQ
jgi:DNA-binding transcriptional LysR family regulator